MFVLRQQKTKLLWVLFLSNLPNIIGSLPLRNTQDKQRCLFDDSTKAFWCRMWCPARRRSRLIFRLPCPDQIPSSSSSQTVGSGGARLDSVCLQGAVLIALSESRGSKSIDGPRCEAADVRGLLCVCCDGRFGFLGLWVTRLPGNACCAAPPTAYESGIPKSSSTVPNTPKCCS